ncbi:hypothetical protein HOO54_15730 [Bacillus sp. WMMC1349]|uniref:hypothetical protein n=1 Tax=Bacillus sp. WMMC1349 TaxID=2736254 RepID=UPI001554CDD8|nr:hypothetical protein [Bacillus sp. WMMC1349]NPC93642.1 hypothetical protein [Bacillus sp. WMMC1349]
MAKAITAPFSERPGDQDRLTQVGGSIFIDKRGKVLFRFPSMDAYREWQKLGTEAYKRKVGAAK